MAAGARLGDDSFVNRGILKAENRFASRRVAAPAAYCPACLAGRARRSPCRLFGQGGKKPYEAAAANIGLEAAMAFSSSSISASTPANRGVER